MKHDYLQLVISITLFMFFSAIALSQRKREQFVDSQYVCSYKVNYINDTILMTKGTEDKFILQIGKDITFGYSYLRSQMDSLVWTPDFWNYFFEEAKNNNASKYYSSNLGFVKLFKNFKTKIICVIDHISIHSFFYEEILTPQVWTMKDDTMNITGYSCQKAICDYRGRSYEAWFTTEIPISEGPWKFSGLPGLIVKLYDTKHHYDFELMGFSKSNAKIDIQPLTTKKIKVTPRRFEKLTKTDRIKFLKTKFGEQGHQIMNVDMAKVGISNAEPVIKKYDYIELDYK